MIYTFNDLTDEAYKLKYRLPDPVKNENWNLKVDFVKQQLIGISPNAEWTNGGKDRARDLAEILVNADVTDLWALKIYPVVYQIEQGNYWQPTESGEYFVPSQIVEQPTFAFEYCGRNIGYLGTSRAPVNTPFLERAATGFKIGWSSEGKGHIDYIVRPNAEKTALEIVPIWASSSDAADIRAGLKFIVGAMAMMLPLAGVGLGAIIGAAVLPASVVAAYPAATAIVGNVALSAALNGGDVQSAVKNAIIGAAGSFAGAQTGGFIGSAVNSETVGALAGAATRAALTGGDIELAVATAGLQQGAQYADSYFSGSNSSATIPSVEFYSGNEFSNITAPESSFTSATTQGQTMDDFNFSNWASSYDWSYDNIYGNDGNAFSLDPFNSSLGTDWGAYFDSSGSLQYTADYFDTMSNLNNSFLLPEFSNSFADPGFVINDTNYLTGFENAFAIAPTGTAQNDQVPNKEISKDSNVWQPTQIIQGITAAAMAVIGLIKAYRSLDTPKVNTIARKVNADGSVSVITDNGMVSSRSASGQITTTLPPVGVPQSTVNGNTVVNNGDGTYTIVSPSGQSATYRYDSSATGSGAISPGMLALAAGAFFLLNN